MTENLQRETKVVWEDDGSYTVAGLGGINSEGIGVGVMF
jgi:hypothetical protein